VAIDLCHCRRLSRRHGAGRLRGGPPLSRNQKAVNRSHAKVRALVEQAIATLKCSTTRITSLVQAVLTLQLASSN